VMRKIMSMDIDLKDSQMEFSICETLTKLKEILLNKEV
jgi:hypothetical protein